jgi:pimeloyl-ACP methyl ester carboxylesterase
VGSVGAYLAVLGLVMATFATSSAPATAQTGGFQRGPNPTSLTLSMNGPFRVSRTDVSGLGAGFNNVTVCYPSDTSQGTFGGFVVIPGFLAGKWQMMWACDKIASHGFVVAVMETSTVLDFPFARRSQAQAAIRHLSGASAPQAIRERLDPNRWAVGGWSMGGGGALEAGIANNPRLEAVVGWQPWDIASFAAMQVPSLIVGASNDFVASPTGMAEPFYNSMLTAEKQYVELRGQGHFVGSSDNTDQSAVTIAWLKRWVDDDTRYNQFLCPPRSGLGIAETRSTCPY